MARMMSTPKLSVFFCPGKPRGLAASTRKELTE